MLLGHALEIGGVVVAGEGIFLAADIGDDLGKDAVRIVLCSLEHQVLKEVGNTGLAGRLIGGARLVPDHMGDHGGAVIGDHHHLKTVVQREAGQVRRNDRRRFGRSLGKRQAGAQNKAGQHRGEEKAAPSRSGKCHLGDLPEWNRARIRSRRQRNASPAI